MRSTPDLEKMKENVGGGGIGGGLVGGLITKVKEILLMIN